MLVPCSRYGSAGCSLTLLFRSCMVIASRSIADVAGMSNPVGKNCTVFDLLVAFVAGM